MPTTTDTLDARSLELVTANNYVQVATLRRDGSPSVNPVWVDARDGLVWLNSAEGRAWPANLRRDPRVALSVQNLDNPEEYVAIRGRVSEITTDGADEHIDYLAKKYLGAESYPYRKPGQQRIIIKITPDWVMRRG